jgi:hypothetical protein
MRSREFAVDDWVVYRKLKHSASPGPRARDVSAAPNGEGYSYLTEGLRPRLRYVAAMRLGAFFDFCQVVLQMGDVVYRQELERHWLVVANSTGHAERFGGNAPNDVC